MLRTKLFASAASHAFIRISIFRFKFIAAVHGIFDITVYSEIVPCAENAGDIYSRWTRHTVGTSGAAVFNACAKSFSYKLNGMFLPVAHGFEF